MVTGASGGIGRAVAEELRSRGWEVVSWSRSHGVDASDEAAVESAAARLARWDALSESGEIHAGESVVITARNGLKLKVRKAP